MRGDLITPRDWLICGDKVGIDNATQSRPPRPMDAQTWPKGDGLDRPTIGLAQVACREARHARAIVQRKTATHTGDRELSEFVQTVWK